MHFADLTAICFSCITVLVLGYLHYRKRARVGLNDYLEVLDFDTWKSTDCIQDQMELDHQGWLDSFEVICSLIILENEGRIIHRIIPHVTPNGVKEIHEFRRGNDEGGENIPSPVTPPPHHGMQLPQFVSTHKTPQFAAGFFMCTFVMYTTFISLRTSQT